MQRIWISFWKEMGRMEKTETRTPEKRPTQKMVGKFSRVQGGEERKIMEKLKKVAEAKCDNALWVKPC